MKSKSANLACFSLILVAAAVVVRSDPMEPFPVATPEKREMRQPQPTESRPSIGDRVFGLLSRTRNEKEEERAEKQVDHGNVADRLPSQELKSLKEIAAKLSIAVPEDDSPENITFLIKQRLGETVRYRGRVLSDENARDVKAQILEKSDAETFAAYHDFVKKIAGKRILILETDE